VLKGTAADLQLNRSPRTFMLNADALATMEALHPTKDPAPDCKPVHETGEAREDFNLHGCPRRRATDPTLTVLQIRRSGDLVGAMVFYAGHPTVLDPPAPIYSSDFTGVAMSTLEKKRASSSKPVFGFFNGAEGDIVVKRSIRDVREVVAVGNAFADRVDGLLGPPPRDSLLKPVITTRGAELDTQLERDRECGGSWLAEKPLMGAPALGGAEDDRTVFHGLGYRKGRRWIARNGHGGKLGAFDSPFVPNLRLTKFVAPARKFPNKLPLRYVKIGNFVLATVPGEFSAMAGRNIVEGLKGEGGSADHVVVVGLANEYTGYVTTADEYAAQDYMAASTLWGPGEARVFTCRLEGLKALAAAPAPKEPMVIKEKRYFPGHPPKEYDSKMRFGPHGVGEERSAADEELAEILLDYRGVPARGLPAVFWTETVADGKEFEAAALRSVSIRRVGQTMGPSVSPGTDQSPEPKEIEDESGYGVVTLLRKAPLRKESERMMAAIWLGPILDDGLPEDLYQFRIKFTDKDGKVNICDSLPFKASRETVTQSNEPIRASCGRALADGRKR
jgi:neutral ceramidase